MIKASFFLLSIVISFVSSAEEFGLDKDLFQKLVEDVKSKENKELSKEEIFLNLMWPKIQEFFPTEAIIPAVESQYEEYKEKATEDNNVATDEGGEGNGDNTSKNVVGQEEKKHKEKEQIAQGDAEQKQQTYEKAGDSYGCQTEAKLVMKLNDLTEDAKKTFTDLPKKKKIQMDIVAELKVEQPINFHVVFSAYDLENPIETKMNYFFKRSNKVKISMLIPDFSDKVTAECLVTVTDIEAIKFDEPECHGSEVTDTILSTDSPLHYFKEIDENRKFYEAVSAGLMKAFIQKVNAAKKGDKKALFRDKKIWICMSDEFKKREPDLKKRFSYSGYYKTFCGRKNA